METFTLVRKTNLCFLTNHNLLYISYICTVVIVNIIWIKIWFSMWKQFRYKHKSKVTHRIILNISAYIQVLYHFASSIPFHCNFICWNNMEYFTSTILYLTFYHILFIYLFSIYKFFIYSIKCILISQASHQKGKGKRDINQPIQVKSELL